jgi:predicted DNA-binding transcriptional regulator AlpA
MPTGGGTLRRAKADGDTRVSKLISNAEAAQRLGASASGLYRLRAQADFPKPIRLSGPCGKPLWDEAEIDAFIARRRQQAA